MSESVSASARARPLVVGVIGHVDHGKSALVRALTGTDTDRLPEEKQRGISIALGFAHLALGESVVDLIDMPGHERFVRTMVSGATGIDAVLLVLAANEGIKPQTVEHVDIAALLGLQHAVIAISKVDLVEPETARRVAEEGMRLLVRAGLEPLPPVMTSALRASGIEDLRQALMVLAARPAPRAADGRAFLPIDRAFSVAGHGPVITGTLRGAPVAAADVLELWPAQRQVRVRAIQIHGARVPTAAPGQRVALNLRDVESAELARGMVLAAPDTLVSADWLTISLRAVADAPPLKNGMRLSALLGTGEAEVRLRLLDREVLEAGERGLAQLHCALPVALPAGEHLVLRLVSPPRTVAGGRVLEVGTRRQRRHSAPVLERLEDLHALPPEAMLAAEVEREGAAGTSLRHLAQLSSLTPLRIVELLKGRPIEITRAGLVVRKVDLEQLIARIPAILTPHATGLALEPLRAELPGTGPPVLKEALERLLVRGLIIERGGRYLVPRPEEDRARALDEAQLASRIAETLRQGGLTPPDVGTIVTDLASKRALDRLLREGIVVRAVDRAKGKQILFHREAIEHARRQLAPLLERAPGLLVTEVGAALGISRKYSIPLLDHLDTIRFTRRIADRRMRGI